MVYYWRVVIERRPILAKGSCDCAYGVCAYVCGGGFYGASVYAYASSCAVGGRILSPNQSTSRSWSPMRSPGVRVSRPFGLLELLREFIACLLSFRGFYALA